MNIHETHRKQQLGINLATIIYITILEAKSSELIDDGDYDDNEDDKNVDVHDEYDTNVFSSNENNVNYESDYRPSASVAQLVKKRVLPPNTGRVLSKLTKISFLLIVFKSKVDINFHPFGVKSFGSFTWDPVIFWVPPCMFSENPNPR